MKKLNLLFVLLVMAFALPVTCAASIAPKELSVEQVKSPSQNLIFSSKNQLEQLLNSQCRNYKNTSVDASIIFTLYDGHFYFNSFDYGTYTIKEIIDCGSDGYGAELKLHFYVDNSNEYSMSLMPDGFFFNPIKIDKRAGVVIGIYPYVKRANNDHDYTFSKNRKFGLHVMSSSDFTEVCCVYKLIKY